MFVFCLFVFLTYRFCIPWLHVSYGMRVRTLLSIGDLHTGHVSTLSPHDRQQHRWLHGWNITSHSESRQTLHFVFCLSSLTICSRSGKKPNTNLKIDTTWLNYSKWISCLHYNKKKYKTNNGCHRMTVLYHITAFL